MPRPPRASERGALVRWLDDGLREGRRGRLEAEYPLSMHRGNLLWHRAVFEGGRPVAHAMIHCVEVAARARRLPLGLIGNVYTDPAARGRGLASACIESCVAAAKGMGIPVVALWSELDTFYDRLGFHESGRERYLAIDGQIAGRATTALAASAAARKTSGAAAPDAEIQVGPAQRADFAELEGLYADKEVRVLRAPGALARLAAAPDTQMVVARRFDRPVAYAAMGRGDDFDGVVHEWAGEDAGVLACLAALCERREGILVLHGPVASEACEALLVGGAGFEDACFARVRLLDASRLWTAIGNREIGVEQADGRVRLRSAEHRSDAPSWKFELSEAEALRWFFGSASPGSQLSEEAALLLPPSARESLEALLPWPLYVWGFDSI